MGTDEVPAADRARRSEIERRALGGVLALALGLMACGETPPPAVSGPESAPIETSLSASGAGFNVDPFWPRELPDGWLLGNVVGVATDSADNVWIIHRPNSQTGAADTPPVIALSPAGDVVQSWGGPGEGYD